MITFTFVFSYVPYQSWPFYVLSSYLSYAETKKVQQVLSLLLTYQNSFAILFRQEFHWWILLSKTKKI